MPNSLDMGANAQLSPQHVLTKRVMVVDDHLSVVEMVIQFLDSLGGFTVVGQATTVDEAIRVGLEQKPDLVILDLVLENGATGLRLIDDLRRASPNTRYMIYSGNLTLNAVRAALSGGVLGIVDKGSPLSELRQALRSTIEGTPYYSSSAAEYLRHLVREKRNDTKQVDLSPRERSVLSMLAEGLSSKEIAARLGLSMHTVVNHRSNLMRKTGLHRVAQLSRYAVEIGLLNPPRVP
ncbi:LuxR C-terminal-related transcriptional regulator [Synoicihabitans lomoniglobus]|uniref:Response regulator transcription factor n=1 Tax=Synoicihabitans lomoniglobus TaxID=2909285 RepID=A0AAF0CRS5_9BACT|nr:response regulator transcription factor [Opitutaceae bacterium LMO-M01]WED66786.1 response regulator transcription factor [Opitutaceae bacterium LMO-M01]